MSRADSSIRLEHPLRDDMASTFLCEDLDAQTELINQKFALDQHAIVAVTDTQGRIIYVNDKFCELSRYSRDELLGQDHRIVNSGYHDKVFFQNLWRTIAHGEVWHCKFCNRDKNDGFYWVDTTIVPFKDRDGEVIQYVSIGTDITDHMTVQESLAQANLDLKNQKFALDQHAIVAVTDTKGRITYVNDKFCELSKYGRDELLGQDHRLINSGHHGKAFFQNLWITIAHGEVWRGEICNRAKDGGLYWVDTTIVPFKDREGKIVQYVSIRTDITSHMQTQASLVKTNRLLTSTQEGLVTANQQLHDSIEQVREANASKSRFLSTVSHETRTPMNAIIGFTELMLDSDLNRDQREHMQIIQQSAATLLSIINDMLDFSKIEAGKLTLKSIRFDLLELLELACRMTEARLHDKPVQLKRCFSDKLPQFVRGDSMRLQQILVNLLGNAAKFTTEGEIHFEVECRPSSDKEFFLDCSIADTGIGIESDLLDRIFEAFEQADGSNTRHFGGTGLGLTICKELIEQMQGEIGVESEPGAGTTLYFSVLLSRIDRFSPETADDDITLSLVDKSAVVGRVLVVDDSSITRKVIASLLQKNGFDTDVANNGRQAFEMVMKQSFDLVLMDCIMPEMNGLETARMIRDRGKTDLPIVALTANAMDEDRQACLDAGMNDYLAKPVNQKMLVQIVTAWLASKSRTQTDA